VPLNLEFSPQFPNSAGTEAQLDIEYTAGSYYFSVGNSITIFE
jgi:hypothetical protein